MIAFHAIITTYGFWLPNDPRGSWSTYVGNTYLYHFAGEATKTSTTRSVADQQHNSRLRVAAKSCLQHPAVQLSGTQAHLAAQGFAFVADESGYAILALAVMPTHIHAVIGATQRQPSQIIGHLKRGATDRLIDAGIHPCRSNENITHSCWARRSWKVFIDTEKHLATAIRYVENNPAKEGKPLQYWAFVARHRQRWFGRSAPTSRSANAIPVLS